MRASKCMFSPAAALHRVFIAPIARPHRAPAHISNTRITTQITERISQQQRYYAAPASERRLPHDDQIKSWSVILVNEDGKLDEPRGKEEVLSKIDRNKYTLVVVNAGEPGMPPICRIFEKKALREAEKAKKKAGKSPGATTKTLELSWTIDENDLGHKINRMKEFLGKGYKVEIMIARKKKAKRATPDQAEILVEKIKEAITTVEGAKEAKPMEGKLLETTILYIEGKPVTK